MPDEHGPCAHAARRGPRLLRGLFHPRGGGVARALWAEPFNERVRHLLLRFHTVYGVHTWKTKDACLAEGCARACPRARASTCACPRVHHWRVRAATVPAPQPQTPQPRTMRAPGYARRAHTHAQPGSVALLKVCGCAPLCMCVCSRRCRRLCACRRVGLTPGRSLRMCRCMALRASL